MKKIHMIAALLAMLLPMMVRGGTHSTHYGKMTVTASGAGTVYLSTQSSGATSGDASYSWNCNSSSSNDSATRYCYAKPNRGYKFTGWSGYATSTDNPYALTLSATGTSSSSPTTANMTAKFEQLPPVSVTFAAPNNGSYTVNGETVSAQLVKANQAAPYSATLVATPTANFRFAGWYVLDNGSKSFFSTDASTTKDFEEDATVGAEFVPDGYAIYAAVAGKGYDDLATALSEALPGESISVYSSTTLGATAVVEPGVSLTVASGVTLTVASGATLYIDGSATVNGAIAGTVSRCTKLIQQTGDGTVNAETGKPNPFNPYGSAKYWKTSTSTPSIPSISGAGSHTTIVNGYGEAFRTTEVTSSSTFIFVNVDTSKAVNHITGIKSVSTVKNILTATISGGMAVLVSSSCVINGGTSSKTTFTGRIDAAGQTLVSVNGVEVSNGGASYLLNCPSFSMKKSVNNNFSFYNCDSVSFSTFNAKTANLSFYDCGTFANPASCSFSYAASPTADAKFSFYSGYYNSLTFPSVAKVYGGSYKNTPASYLADVDTLEVVYESASKYYVVQEKKQVTYLVSIGTAQYETLAEAISAAKSGDTIALIERVDLTGTTLTVPADKNITIALDKHSIVGGKIVNNGTLVFTDSTIYSDGLVSSEIENAGSNATLDFVFGTYSGAIANTAGTLTVHNGVFTGAFTQGGGTVNLKGGHFTANVSDLVTNDGYAVVMSDGKYCVCERPDGTMKSVTVENVPGYSATPYSTSNPNEYTLLKNARGGAKTRNDYSMSDWMRIAELLTFYEVFHNSGMDPTLVFDRNVAQNSLNLGTTPSSYGMAQIKFDVVAGKPYRALTENLTAAAKTWQAIFDDNISSVAVSVSDKSGNNKGTLCKAMIEVWESQKVGSTRVTNTVFVVGQKVFVINAGSNAAMIRPATGAATFYATLGAAMDAAADGGTVMLANDCDTALPLNKAGTYTFDTMGFAASDAVSVSDGLFVKSETAVDSSAKALVPDAKATTYVVAQKVASVGETFYDNLTEAVGAANGATVTLLAATDETITLTTEGQTLSLNKNGIAFDDAKVVTTVENGSVSVSADESGTLYTAITSVVDASDGNKYGSVGDAVENVVGDEIAVTVTVNVTEEVTLPQGKALTVTTADGVDANITVAAPDGAFIVESAVEDGTKYESKKITVEMSEPSSVANVEVKQIENGDTNAVNNAAAVNAAVAKLTGNGYVPRTDNTDKLDVVDKITVTPTKIVQEVVGAAAAIIRAATFDVVPTYKAGQSLGEGQKLKFRLPVDSAATQLASIIYHNGEQFGVYPVQTENEQKFVEVESDTFSPYGYELLDGETENPIAAIGTTGYATLGAAIEAASNGDTITVFAGTFDIGSDTITVNKQVTITGAGKDTTILNSSVSGKGAFSIAADNVTIEDLTISLSNNSDMTRAINVGNKPQTSVVSNTTLQRLKFVGGRNALSVYASNLMIDSCDFSEQYRDAILLYTVQGTSAITGNTFVQTTPGGQGFIYGTSSDGTDPLSSGTLTISGNTATGGRCLYHCNNQDRFDTTTKMTLDIVGNLATDYNNKGIVFAGHESTPLSSIFNSITITNNTLFTSANRPAIQRDDTDTSSLAIDASGNYWGSASPDFDTPVSGDKYLIMPHTDSNNVVVDSYGTTYTPNSSSPGATVNNLLYKVTFVDEDSTTILYETNLASGNTPVYGGTTPTKAATAQYTFTWVGWTYGGNTYGTADTLAPVADAAQTYTATYSSVVNDCTVTVTIPANSTITVKQNGAAISPDAGTDNAFTVPYGTELTVEYAATGAYIAGGTQSQVVTADSTKTVAAPNDYSVAPAVAQIGSTYYPTLAAAITDANAGNTITMLADVTLMANMESNYALWIDKSVVIDGCNHVITISGNRRGMGIVGSHDVSVTNVVTLQNLSIVSASNQDGKLIFTQCNSSNGLYLELNMSSVTLNARNASAPMTQPLTISGQHSDPITVNITDSAIDAGDNGVAITIYNPAIMTITGSEISAWMGIGARYYSNDIRSSGTVLTIDDCTLNGINKYTSGDADQAIISVYDEGVTVNVTDTDFNVSSTGSYTEFAVAFFGGRSTVTSRINLGEGNKVLLEGDAEIADEYYNESDEDTYTFGRVAISGGVFSDEPPSACLAEGYTVTSNEDPATEDDYWYAVLPAVAKIVSEYGTDYFATLEEAIDAADIMEVSSITILDDSIATSPDQGWNIIEDGGEKYLVRTTFYNVWVGGTQITSANAADVFGNGKVSYDDATKTLTLNGYTYSGAGYGSSAVYIGDMGGATFNVVVAGENSLTSTAAYGYAIRSVGTGAVTVTGSGSDPSLALTVPSAYDTGYAVSVKGASATFKDLSMAVTGYLGIVVNGNNAAGDALTIDNCDITFAGTAMDQAVYVQNREAGEATLRIVGSALTGAGSLLVHGENSSGCDADVWIEDSEINLTGAYDDSRHGIEVYSSYGDATLVITNCNSVTIASENAEADAVSVIAANKIGDKGSARLDIVGCNSVSLASDSQSGVTVATWDDTNATGEEATINILRSTVEIVGDGAYGLQTYGYGAGETHVSIIDSEVDVSANWMAIQLGAEQRFSANVGEITYAQTNSEVYAFSLETYGLTLTTLSTGRVNTDASVKAIISGGLFDSTGAVVVQCDDPTNAELVMTDGAEVNIDSSTATETEEDAILTGGKLTIDSGKYSFSYPDGLSAATNTVVGNITGGIFTEDVSDLCAEGYIAVDNTDAETKDAYPYMVRAAEYVAQIVRGDEVIAKYESFDEALDAAAQTGDTIQLLTDVTGPFVLGKSASITLDLNGKTLSVESGNAISVTAGELTVTSVVDDDGYATGGVVGAIAVSEGAALNIQGGIYDVDWSACNIEGTIEVSSVNRFYEWDPTEVEAASAVFTSPVPYEYCADGFISGAYDDIFIDGEYYYYVKEGVFLWKITDADGKVAYSEDTPYADDDEEYWEYDWFGEHEMNRNGFTMTLLHDVAAGDDFSAYVSGLTYTVDLGGYTVNRQMGFGVGECDVTITNGVISNAGGTAISIANGAQVTLGDNLVISQSTTGVNVEGGTEAGAYSKLTVTDGATINGTYGVLVFGSGSENPVTEVVVEGGTITGTTYGISGNGTIEGDVDYSNTRITISGGTVTGGIAGIYHPQAGALNMSSGTVSGGMAIYAKSGTISVTGGELSANGASGQYDQSYAGSGPQQTGDALALDSVNYPGGNPTATISGGTFSSVNGEGVASYAATGQTAESGFVSGGIFSSEVPEEYCADGYIPREGVIVTISGVDYYTVKTGAYVAQIITDGGATTNKYETFTNALDVAQSGDTIQLLKDVEGVTETFELRSKNLTIDGQGLYSITAGENTTPRSVIESWGGARNMFVIQSGNVTFKDITLDGGETHYYTFLVQAKNGTTTFDNVELLHGGEADSSGTAGVGYGAAVQVDGATVLVTNSFYACTGTNENNATTGVFPFTALLYQSGIIHFYDDVTADIGDDLLLVGMVGAVDVSTPEGKAQVQEMLDAMNVPAGYYPYTLKLGDNALTSFTGASPLGWNGIIDYGTDIMNAANTSMGMDLDPDTTPVEVGLLTDTVLPETFTYEDSNFTINGNGNALSGTIEYTDDAGTMENIVMGTDDKPLVLDMTGLGEGNAINLGTGISATNVTIKVTEEQATTLGQAIVTWNTEGESEEDVASLESGVKVEIVNDDGDPVTDPVTGDPMEASIIWDAEMGVAYIGPCEARLTGPTHETPIYTSLASAIARAANSGDTVTLLTNIVNYTGTQEISKSLTLDGAGHKIAAAPVTTHRDVVHAWAGSTAMFKLETGNITIKNIELDGDATHADTFLISADNSSVNLTTENIRLLNGGELCGDANGDVVEPGAGYGAAIHLNNGAHLTVKDGFYADTHGAPAEPGQTVGMSDGVFPFTGILPEGGSSVLFDLTEDTNAEPTVEIGKDLLLVGMVGAIDSETAQGILDYMKVPSRFRPYTLTLGDGSAYAFTGASLLGWNEIIEYGKEIMDVSTAVGYEGLDKDDTPVEVGLLTDTVLPDKFVYEDSNFTVNGNGNALSGTIEYTDNAGVIENIVFGTEEAPLVLDLRNVTDPVEIGRAISVTNVTVLMTEDQAQLGQPVFTWNTESAEEPVNSEAIKITVMPDAQSEPTGDEPTKGLVWDDEMGVAYIGPCEARLTGLNRDPGYMDLTNAFKYAVSGDVITLFWSNVTLNASVTLPAGNLLFTTNKYELAVGEDAEFVFTNVTSVFRTELDVLDELVLDGDCATGYLLRYEEEGSTNKYSVAERGIYIVTGNTEDGSEGTATIKVSDEWVAANVGDNIRTANEVEDVLNSADTTTGMRKWEAYVLKQTTAPFKVTSVNASNDSLTTSLGDPEETETTGFTVAYSLAEADASGVVVNPGTPVSSRIFTVPVDEVTSNAFYRVRAHLTSGGSTLVVDSTNTIGVLKVDSVRSQTILAVPWADIGSGEDVAVSDLMRTKTLTEGDTLYAYDAESGKYKVWELSASKEWEPIAVSTKEDCTPGESAGLATVKRGAGLWLERANPTAALHLVGEVSTSSATSSLVAASEVGKDGKQGWNVVAPPSALPYDLNSITPAGGSFGTYDRIVIPTTGAPKNYTYENGSWGYYSMQPVYRNGVQVGVRSKFNTEDTKIPAGTGFWYLNSGNSTTVTW